LLLGSSRAAILAALAVSLAVSFPGEAHAQGPAADGGDAAEESWAVHGQSTFVWQYHPGFASPFRGLNSLKARENDAETADVTLYGGVRPWRGAEIWVNPELDQGFGTQQHAGRRRVPQRRSLQGRLASPLWADPAVFLRQTLALGGDSEKVVPDLNQLGGTQTADRVVLTIGKFSVTDIFDTNRYAHDPRGDFLNWAIIDIGSFDYAADAWGFTYGAAVEWYRDWWTIRAGIFDLSKTPNSKALDTNFISQDQYDLELEERHTIKGQPGKLKLLGFITHGRMGSYNAAVSAASLAGTAADITLVRAPHTKAGAGLNLEQQLTEDLGFFARAGITQGGFEAFDFTDINKTISFGLSATGGRWGRPDDTVGLAVAINGASRAAERFFNAGGLGILAGDGRLPIPAPSGSSRPTTALPRSASPSSPPTASSSSIPPTTAIAARSRYSGCVPTRSSEWANPPGCG